MRGRTNAQCDMFYLMDVESLVASDHPLRAIKPRMDAELARLRPLFNQAYARNGAFLDRLERKHDVGPHLATRESGIKGWDEGAWARRKAHWREQTEGAKMIRKPTFGSL